MKHFNHHANKYFRTITQMFHLRAMLCVLKNVTVGNLSKQVGVETSIKRYKSKENRAANLAFIRMQVMTMSPHSIPSNDHMRFFLCNLSCYTSHANGIVVHHLLETYMCVTERMRTKLRRAKKLYSGLSFSRAVSDLWTEKHRSKAFGSVVRRFFDPGSGCIVVLHRGVSLFTGRHDDVNIKEWHLGRLAYFGMTEADLCSTTTDYGANVCKAMLQLLLPWLP